MQGPQPSSSFTVPGTTEGMNYTNDGDIGTRIQEQLSEEDSRANPDTLASVATSNPSRTTHEAPRGETKGKNLKAPTTTTQRKQSIPASIRTPTKKTSMAHSSPMSSPTVPGTVKASGSKDQSKSDSVSRASTPNPNTALVRREKSGPVSAVTTVENGIAMVVGGNVVQGLSNCLTAIDEAPKEIRRGLTMDLAGTVTGTLGIMGAVAEKVDDFVQARGFRNEEYLEINAALVTLADTVRQERDKVGTRNRKIKDN